ncbi:hypothetical protein FEM08_29170 [Flavobacterium gilvum]|nr:hypothetical protein FEM08_29170 [Flavobacterium gilvum]
MCSFIYRKERKDFNNFINIPQGSQSFANLAVFKKAKLFALFAVKNYSIVKKIQFR